LLKSNLTVLNLSECNSVDGSTVTCIVNLFHNQLRTLKLDKCPQIDDNCITYALSKIRHLQELSLMFCVQLTDKALMTNDQSTDKQCLQLRHIFLGGNTNLTEKSVLDLVDSSPKLKTCSIPAIPAISDLTLVHLGKACLAVQHVNVALCINITPLGVRSLVEGCKNLKTLDFGGLEKLTDLALDSIQKCQALKLLDISRTVHLTDIGICALVKACKNLSTLRMRATSPDTMFPACLFQDLQKLRPNLTVIKNY